MKESILKLRILLSVSTLMGFNLPSSAQIADWLADQIRSEIQNQISSVTNYNSNYLGSFGSYIWESVVNAKCESDLKEKALEFRNFNIDRSFLDRVPKKYPRSNKYWSDYAELSPLLYSHANGYFHGKSDIKFRDAAHETIARYAVTYIDSVSSTGRLNYKELVLNQAVIDSLAMCASFPGDIDSVTNDMKQYPTLAIFLNNHPEAVRVYCNSIMAPGLRRDTRHLSYWALKADSHRHLLNKKQRLLNPRHLRFVQKDKGIDILQEEELIGQIVDEKLYVCNINLMNLLGRPNTTYVLADNQWMTDEYGRVEKTTQMYGKSYKGKCKQKSKLNVKKLKGILNEEAYAETGFYNQPEFGAPEVLLNTYFFEKTPENKTVLSDAKKLRNRQIKESGVNTCVTNVEYCNHKSIPASVVIDGHCAVKNSGLTIVSKATTKPNIQTFDMSYKKRRDAVANKNKIEIVKGLNSTSAADSSSSFGINIFCEPLSKKSYNTAEGLAISKTVFKTIQSMKGDKEIYSVLLKAGFTCTSKKKKTYYDEPISEYVTYLEATYTKAVSGGKIIVKQDMHGITITFPNTTEKDNFLKTIKAEQAKGYIYTTDDYYWVGVRIELNDNTIVLVEKGGY